MFLLDSIFLHFLIAAHCFGEWYTRLARDIVVLLGGFDLSNFYEYHRIPKPISRIVLHDDWNPGTTTFDADLAVLVLEDEILFSRYVKPVCLWWPLDDLIIKKGIVTGWGESENASREFEPIPRQLNVPIHTNEECFLDHKQLVDISSRRTFCAGSGTGDGTCFGDSGNGLFFLHDNVFHLKGIVSSAYVLNSKCNLNVYSVYTNVLKFRSWIEEAMKIVDQTGKIIIVLDKIVAVFSPLCSMNIRINSF